MDATNVVSAEVAVLTGLAFDHTEYLGDTIGQIAGEKLGIVGPGARLVCGGIPSEAAPVVERKARTVGADVMWLGKDFGVRSILPRPEGGWVVSVDGLYGSYEDLHLPLRGRYQIHNLAVALAAAEAWMERGLDADRLRAGMPGVSAPGRMELVRSGSAPLLLDGAHNPAASAVLARSLSEEFGPDKWVAVLGVMGDKDLESMMGALAPHLERVVASRADSPRAMDPDEISRRIASVCDVPVVECRDPGEAIGMASRLAGPTGRVLVTGSLYLVGDVRTLLGL